MGIPIKKTLYAKERESERVRKLREEFRKQQPEFDPKHLVFVDESGMRLGATPRYGWAKRGKKALGYEKHHWKSVTMIGAIGSEGIVGFTIIEAPTTSLVFRAFAEQVLAPNLRPGDCVVLDNLSAHKDSRARQAIEKVGAKVVFLPPYSPDMNPIEPCWAKMKPEIRRHSSETRTEFDEAVYIAGKSITPDDIKGWMHHSGYSITLN